MNIKANQNGIEREMYLLSYRNSYLNANDNGKIRFDSFASTNNQCINIIPYEDGYCLEVQENLLNKAKHQFLVINENCLTTSSEMQKWYILPYNKKYVIKESNGKYISSFVNEVKLTTDIEEACYFNIIIHPEFEDDAIMKRKDYLAIIALKRYYIESYGDKKFKLIESYVFTCIEEIRSKYSHEYTLFSNTAQAKLYYYLSLSPDSNDRFAVSGDKAKEDPVTLVNWGLFIASAIPKSGYFSKTIINALSINYFPPSDLLDVAFFITSNVPNNTTLNITASFLSTLKNQIAINNRDEYQYVTKEDYTVEISFWRSIYSSSVRTAEYTFQNGTAEIKNLVITNFLGSQSSLGRYLIDTPKYTINVI